MKANDRGRKVVRPVLTICIFLLIFGSGAAASASDDVLMISTTTSTQASGLLDELIPAFEKETGIDVRVVAKGTGAALRDGMDGNVDAVLVHDRQREKQFVAGGYGTERYQIMHNDFVIVGPPADPAGIDAAEDALDALERIADKDALFVSRGDGSGTHAKEQQLWQASAVEVTRQHRTIEKGETTYESRTLFPADAENWYLSIGQGMGKTLMFADEKQAYTVTDRGTYLKYRYGKDRPVELAILKQDEKRLANPYAIIPVNPDRFAHVNADDAQRFVQWITSEDGQAVIAGYRLYGRQLFYPDIYPNPKQ
ncbi:MAG: substrate-binding domain-containing protein [Thermodesulfobacteriota bacterium]